MTTPGNKKGNPTDLYVKAITDNGHVVERCIRFDDLSGWGDIDKEEVREEIERTGQAEVGGGAGGGWIYLRVATVHCCGVTFPCDDFTNTCADCGADYDSAGNRLAPREQWGEETGETAADILRPGDPFEDGGW